MSALQGKKILLGICGGIAAYKSVSLVRTMIKSGAEVRVICSPDALDFVSPLSLATMSKHPVLSQFSDEQNNWNNHVELALWADLMLIAPLTARSLSAMAYGHCNNLLLATYLSAKCPVVVAPAMDLDMYAHPTTGENLNRIASFGNHIIPAAEGELASGLVGKGRMESPENITDWLENFFVSGQKLKGKKILITAGPTYEAIDPVRFVGNHSSGKMGFEIAKCAANMGADVLLISGPTAQKCHHKNIERIDVVSAMQMYTATQQHIAEQDVAIMSAAVADYRPENVSEQKIKKKTDEMTIRMVKNPDILKSVGDNKGNTFLVGFALETEDAVKNAQGKLQRKNADMIVLNTLADDGAGFGKDTNKVSFVTHENVFDFPLKSKKEVAQDILNFVADKI